MKKKVSQAWMKWYQIFPKIAKETLKTDTKEKDNIPQRTSDTPPNKAQSQNFSSTKKENSKTSATVARKHW